MDLPCKKEAITLNNWHGEPIYDAPIDEFPSVEESPEEIHKKNDSDEEMVASHGTDTQASDDESDVDIRITGVDQVPPLRLQPSDKKATKTY